MINLVKKFFETGIKLNEKQLELVEQTIGLNIINIEASQLIIQNETKKKNTESIFIISRIEYLSSIDRTPEQDNELEYYEKINNQNYGNSQN